ncbi:transcriptional regulator PhoU [Methylophilales bacterium MBRSG12]|uniref:Phosphate-specific transport system accessory protein PhoU n=1 Tax=Methylophilales bacterium MBRS-H7 TaxID=1623450 RepID=A0A0H4IXK7_9PROT|nr:transcriptional regulator PhoU [Methylophilales bacterium MBRSF5]AKO65711.1 transcriptional regulator PhoU [Methylophilales bacterium MBRS-H7]AKO67032.1 transcriptional regulator PhoU [Methylophilales bacterium MBRSG12]
MAFHSYSVFDQELENLRAQVMEMGGIVEEQIKDAVSTLKDADSKTIDRVIARDEEVNQLQMQIDESCELVLVKRTPVSSDLRFVLCVQKITTDLERIGDEATKIARAAKRIFEDDRMAKPSLTDIKTISKLISKMLHDALDSFARMDPEAVLALIKRDETVDEKYQLCMRHQLTFMLEDPRKISTALEVIYVAKALERIGDHSENITEHVVYCVKGADVRHSSPKEIRKELKS